MYEDDLLDFVDNYGDSDFDYLSDDDLKMLDDEVEDDCESY